MNPESGKLAETLFKNILKSKFSSKVDVVICPPILYLERLKKISKKITLGVQNISSEERGAFTGEVSSLMAYDVGARYTIVGHSERRAMGETNGFVNKKIKLALKAGLTPILCVGESIRDESHGYFNLVKTQLDECLVGLSKTAIAEIIIAYEPIWAISSTINRKDATSADSREMAVFIRKILSDKFGSEASKIRIIYGGSANDKDAEDFLLNGGVDGLLPGRASLDAKKFIAMIKICETLNK